MQLPGGGDPGVHTPTSIAKSVLLSKQNVPSYKIIIHRNKSLEEVHEFGRIFYAGKISFSQSEVSNFQNFLYIPPPLEELGPMAKIGSALI